ncbi:DUF3861 domain-containing protein [uncultured Arcticibacterium sp.]|uniref:DUF3861 domain-containing protein n=1 Tax=uncultured Arcticibacterium sp. TaxID=2173042 RepID=UPI0030F9DE5C
MTEKRNNIYELHLKELQLKDGSEPSKAIAFDFQNHDNIFELLERFKNRELFENKNDNIEFMVGLKLFSEVILKNKKHPIFEEFAPAFGQLMKKLKGK